MVCAAWSAAGVVPVQASPESELPYQLDGSNGLARAGQSPAHFPPSLLKCASATAAMRADKARNRCGRTQPAFLSRR